MKNSDILNIERLTPVKRAKLLEFLESESMPYSTGLELYEAREIVEELEYESSWESSSC